MTELEKERRAQTWLAFASAAVAGVAGSFEYDLEDADPEIAETACDVSNIASAIADEMLAEFESRFTSGANKK